MLCVTGRIERVGKIGNMWVIPVDDELPEDKSVTTGEYRNWRKEDSTHSVHAIMKKRRRHYFEKPIKKADFSSLSSFDDCFNDSLFKRKL